ncbi:beta-ketoacyl synthase N-terminal-like domain-containing protein (plasmid) [Mycobacterium ulcerans]|nr:beta-ketoacyl synthase N-terminal-like domain-containing protein [Mycobacterium ulcerans]
MVIAAGRTEEPVVVMACRFGGVASADQLWDLVIAGRDVVGNFPADRGWDVEDCLIPIRTRSAKPTPVTARSLTMRQVLMPGSLGSLHGGTRDGPQQRLPLEVCWEALETAGIPAHTLAGTSTGVFAGAGAQSYGATNSDGAEGMR